jgi:hypothetical protein
MAKIIIIIINPGINLGQPAGKGREKKKPLVLTLGSAI